MRDDRDDLVPPVEPLPDLTWARLERRLWQSLDAPPVADTLPGYDVVGWFQVFVPTGTPAAIADRIHADVARISQQPDYVARLADLGIYPRPHTQADAREFFAAQQRLMKGLVADLGVQAQ